MGVRRFVADGRPERSAALHLKTLNATEGRVGGYLVVWGTPAQRDLQGEYFTPQTELGLGWYPVRPVLYHHGLGDAEATVIGKIDRLTADESGVWAEAQLDAQHVYFSALLRLVDDGVLSWSSGSLPHLVNVDGDGRIRRWIIVEGSLTPRPAETRHTHVHALPTLKSAYRTLGLDAGTLDSSQSTTETNTSISNQQGDTMNDMMTNAPETAAPRKRLPLGSSEDAQHNGMGVRGLSVSSPYDPLTAEDLLHGYMMLRTLKAFQGVSERYANALAHKIQQGRLSALKSDELSHTAQAGYGDEWVADLWSDTIWQKARSENVILPLFKAIDLPSNPYEVPIEGAAPQVYYVPETRHESQLTLAAAGNPIPDSKIGSGKVQLEAKKLALRVGFTSELVEDSIVPLLNLYREQAVRAIADSIDYALLNGDTEPGATANINHIAGTPSGSERYLAFDGLRKLPLVTNTALKVSMAAAPTLAKLREARFKLPARVAARPSELAWIVDSNTYAALLALPEFLTMDKAGSLATAQTGQIGFIDGIPVFVSAEMSLTDANGMVSAAGGGTKGGALCVWRGGWYVGYRRKIAVSVDYLPYVDSYQLTATVRLAFARCDNTPASLLYNITA
jgi:HK97 family phage major capsid protein